MYRVAVGGISHETHTFASKVTDLLAFERGQIDEGQAMLRHRGAPTALGGILDGLEQAGCGVAPLLYASAMPAGIVTTEAYHTLLTGLLRALEAALPVDGVALVLHGAMVAEGQLDCEGEILEAVRAMVGSHCPVVATLDMHGNVSPKMVACADVLVAFNTNPHLDTRQRGLEAAQHVHAMMRGTINPVAAMARPPLLLSALTTWTEQPPLSLVHEAARSYAADDRVLNISIMGGFAYADTPYSGVSVIVATDDDLRLARQIAQVLADVAWEHREAALYKGLSPEDAVRAALASPDKPVVLADVGDNIGGGAPGDGTTLLQALLKAGAQEAVVVIADAGVAMQAHAAGQGAVIETALGGKQDGWHGDPVHIHGVVEGLTDGRFTVEGKDHFAGLYGAHVDMGPCAVIRCDGVRVLVTTHKTPPGNLNQLRSQGIEPAQQNIIVVKSAVAFRGAYGPIAGHIVEVDTPGLCSSDLNWSANLGRFCYTHIPRPIYPLDVV